VPKSKAKKRFILNKKLCYSGDEMNLLKKNISTTERLVRAILGVIFLASTTQVQGTLMYLAAIVGIILLLTAALGTCPAYNVLGIKTNSTAPEKKEIASNKKTTKKKRK